MRLNEISKTDTIQFLLSNRIINYTIQEDGSIDVPGSVTLRGGKFKKLPVKFGVVGGVFEMNSCANLITLEGSPHEVDSFFCQHNYKLTSLKGSPKLVHGLFYCYENFNMTSLEGSPDWVEDDFDCSFNHSLESLKFLPKHIGGSLLITNLPKVTDYLSIFKSRHIGDIEIEDNRPLQNILNKYLKSRDIIGCQDELIEAGFEEYGRTK
jgi:hypothetical protein